MDNTIHVNAMSRLQSVLMPQSTSRAQNTAFADIMEQQTSLAEYKEEIQRRIAQMPVHSSRMGDNFEIDIPEAGFEAMQNDAEYEAFVLDTISRELSTPNPLVSMTGSSTVFLRFGTEPGQFRADMFSQGDSPAQDIMEGKKKSYWEERQERQEMQNEINDKIADIRARARQLAQGPEGRAAADFAAASEILTVLLSDILASGS